MVAISLSGSGEGLGRAIARGYSTGNDLGVVIPAEAGIQGPLFGRLEPRRFRSIPSVTLPAMCGVSGPVDLGCYARAAAPGPRRRRCRQLRTTSGVRFRPQGRFDALTEVERQPCARTRRCPHSPSPCS